MRITVVVIAQKLLPAKGTIDAAVALGIVALGVLILAAPSAIPGLMPAMSTPFDLTARQT